MTEWTAFHFLRLGWLLLLPLGLWWLWHSNRINGERRRLGAVISAHLLKHLIVGRRDPQRWWPITVAAVIWVLMVVALAGPTWDRTSSPLLRDTAPLVVAVDLSASMDRTDIQPSRLALARYKIAQLLQRRAGSRVAVVAFADSAHVAVPFTEDPSLIELFLPALSSDLLAGRGRSFQLLADRLQSLMADETTPGTLLLVSDADPAELVFLTEKFNSNSHQLIHYRVVPQGGITNSTLELVGVTLDDQDIDSLQQHMQRHLELQQNLDQRRPWLDRGYWLTIPLWLLVLLWFRRGWPGPIPAAWLLPLILLVPPPVVAETAPADWGERFIRLWVTGDQLGRWYFDKGDYRLAARYFEDPDWRGIACYRSGDHRCALEAFEQRATPANYLYLGNLQARLGDWSGALANYEAALLLRSDWRLALENRRQVSLRVQRQADIIEKPPEADPSLEADEIRFDEKGKLGKAGEVDQANQQTEETQLWLKRLQSSPAQFLKRKFAAQQAEAQADD